MKKCLTFLIPAVLALLLFLPSQGQAEEIPARGKVTLLNLKSDCIPCDLQDRIVNRVKKNLRGQGGLHLPRRGKASR